MASFQILDLSFEEDLSDEQAMSIDGGQPANANNANPIATKIVPFFLPSR